MKLFLLLVLGLIAGCDSPTDWLSGAKVPVTVEAVSDAGVLLKDGDGRFRMMSKDYYLGQALISSRKVGDRIK